MDVRDVLIDGIEQLNSWLDDGIQGLQQDQINWLPGGKSVSIGFNAWHILRTEDNVTNFVLQKKMPVWVEQNYFEQFGLPKVDQGTGMSLDDARALQINDTAVLCEYGSKVAASTLEYLKNVSMDELMEMQLVKPLGEMAKWRLFRQVVMTHGFMHLGEINGLKGQLGLQFNI
jgi:hypothetical protein